MPSHPNYHEQALWIAIGWRIYHKHPPHTRNLRYTAYGKGQK